VAIIVLAAAAEVKVVEVDRPRPERVKVLALTVKPEPSELARKVSLAVVPSAIETPLNLAFVAAFWTWSRSELKSATEPKGSGRAGEFVGCLEVLEDSV